MHHISKFNFPIPKTKPKLEMRKLLYPHLTWRSRELLERGREISLCAGRRFRRSESGRKNRPAPFGPEKSSEMQTTQMTAGGMRMCVAPPALGEICFLLDPALRHWANFWRTYGARSFHLDSALTLRLRSGQVRWLFRRKDRACPRSAHLPRRAFAKPEKLFLMMPSMHQMKLSPLCRSQRTQNRMVEQL